MINSIANETNSTSKVTNWDEFNCKKPVLLNSRLQWNNLAATKLYSKMTSVWVSKYASTKHLISSVYTHLFFHKYTLIYIPTTWAVIFYLLDLLCVSFSTKELYWLKALTRRSWIWIFRWLATTVRSRETIFLLHSYLCLYYTNLITLWMHYLLDGRSKLFSMIYG